MNGNPHVTSTRGQRLPPVLARDYRSNVVWPIIGGLTLYTAAGAAFGYLILVFAGIIR